MRYCLSEIADICPGMVLGDDAAVDGASIDSRQITPGTLFVPIVAERDGHDFIDAAMAAGAAGHLTQADSSPWPAVRVDDTRRALDRLGAHARSRIRGAVIGVTGSVGKTTTKDLLAAVVSTAMRCHASFRSFNNELGVPLTLLQAPDDTEALVVEMGARGRGHITALCTIAEPTIGVVLNVGAAHTELFGDLDAVADAKGELVAGLPRTGTAVLNAGDARVISMRSRTVADVVAFGPGGDVTAEAITLDDRLRPSFSLRSPWGSARCSLSSAGLHTVDNALAAAAVGLVLGLAPDVVAAGLAEATISPWRMEVHQLPSGATVVNDAYNANPLSMHAAIDALLALPARRRVAVLGVMAELGERHERDHREVGKRLGAAGVEVISVGVPEYGGTLVDDAAGAARLLGPLAEGDAVLIKASRVAGLERLAQEVTAGA